MTLLGFLPLLALILSSARLSPRLGHGSIRQAVLRSAVVWGFVAVLSLEFLSMPRAVALAPLLILWTALILLTLVSWRAFPSLFQPEPRPIGPGTYLNWTLATVVVGVVLTTGTIAWLAPPNTWDSLNYHMPRIAQWAQLKSVRHFPTGIETQNTMSPGAEMLILHTSILSQGDRWANFIQWFAMLGSLVGVSLIAKHLGAGRRGQWIAAAFVATLPTGIVQASSTMTDFVTGFWVVCVAAETVTDFSGKHRLGRDLIWVGAAAGLAILTKPTAYAYLVPFAAYWGIRLVRITGVRQAGAAAALAVAVVSILNAGHWIRNSSIYGNPISRTSRFRQHGSPLLGGRAFLSNLTRNAAMHLGTPSPHVNKGLTLAVQGFHDLLELEVNDPRTTAAGPFKIRWATLDEDTATNPLHAAAIAISAVVALRTPPERRKRLIRYAVLVFAGGLVFSLLFKWLVFGGRLHHPFFLLAAPLVAVVADDALPDGWVAAIALLFAAAAIPWLLQLRSRPIVSTHTSVESVFSAAREELYFANGAYLNEPYRQIATAISDSECRSVRLHLGGGAAEYPLWVLLEAPWNEMRIGWAVAGVPSSRIPEGLPAACAIVCDDCDDLGYGDSGFVRVLEEASYELYLEE